MIDDELDNAEISSLLGSFQNEFHSAWSKYATNSDRNPQLAEVADAVNSEHVFSMNCLNMGKNDKSDEIQDKRDEQKINKFDSAIKDSFVGMDANDISDVLDILLDYKWLATKQIGLLQKEISEIRSKSNPLFENATNSSSSTPTGNLGRLIELLVELRDGGAAETIDVQRIDAIDLSINSIFENMRNERGTSKITVTKKIGSIKVSAMPAEPNKDRPSFSIFPPPSALIDPNYWLLHASQCDDLLCKPDCIQVKEFLSHARTCSSCDECAWMKRVCGYHVSECVAYDCPLEFCRKYKMLKHGQSVREAEAVKNALILSSDTPQKPLQPLAVYHPPAERSNKPVQPKKKSAPSPMKRKRASSIEASPKPVKSLKSEQVKAPETTIQQKIITICDAVDDNEDSCFMCSEPGVLICCDNCPRSYHSTCLGLPGPPPEDPWHCPQCKVVVVASPQRIILHDHKDSVTTPSKSDAADEARTPASITGSLDLTPLHNSNGKAAIDDQGPLPDGWIVLPSRSRPGQISYQNIHTKERVSRRPMKPAKTKKSKPSNSILASAKPLVL